MGLWQQLQLQEAVQGFPSGNLEMTNKRHEITRRFSSSHSEVLQVALKIHKFTFQREKKSAINHGCKCLKVYCLCI